MRKRPVCFRDLRVFQISRTNICVLKFLFVAGFLHDVLAEPLHQFRIVYPQPAGIAQAIAPNVFQLITVQAPADDQVKMNIRTLSFDGSHILCRGKPRFFTPTVHALDEIMEVFLGILHVVPFVHRIIGQCQINIVSREIRFYFLAECSQCFLLISAYLIRRGQVDFLLSHLLSTFPHIRNFKQICFKISLPAEIFHITNKPHSLTSFPGGTKYNAYYKPLRGPASYFYIIHI